MQKSDTALIRHILSGKRSAERRLYDRYERYWFRLCLRYGSNREEAEDILQEGLIQIFRDLKQFDAAKGAFKNWSGRVLVHAALRYLRKQQWQRSFEALEHAEDRTTSNHIVEQLSAQELVQVIQQLPTGYRIIFNMYEIEGYSHKEIAAALGISTGTSKSQLSKAKKTLRQELELMF